MLKVLFLKKIQFNYKLSGEIQSLNSKKTIRFEINEIKDQQIYLNRRFIELTKMGLEFKPIINPQNMN